MWLGTDVCGCAVVCVDFDGDAEALSKKPDGMLAWQGAFRIMDLRLFASNHIAYTCMLSGNMFSHKAQIAEHCPHCSTMCTAGTTFCQDRRTELFMS